MPTITISEACRAELHAATAPGVPPIDPPIIPPVDPPVVVVPPGGKIINMRILDARPNAGIPWVYGPAPNRHLYTAEAGHMEPYDIVIVEITTPANLGDGTANGQLGWSDVGGDPIMQRIVCLSETPGDFDHPLAVNAKLQATNGSVLFFIGPTTDSQGYAVLRKPNHNYYANFRNAYPSEPTPTGHFDLDLEFRNPKN